MRKNFISALALVAMTAPALAQGEVNVYSSRHYDTDDTLYERFTEETGITVNRVEDEADVLMERMRSEGELSPADVFITVDVGRIIRADEAGLLHIQLTAEASPAWQKAKGGGAPGQGGHLGVADLLRAAEARVGPFLKNGNYAAAFRVYDMFSDACDRVHPAGYRAKFDKEAESPRYLIKKQATAEFERLEEKAMTMEDARRYDEVEALYRDARERFGLPDVKERCNAELERLRDRKR